MRWRGTIAIFVTPRSLVGGPLTRPDHFPIGSTVTIEELARDPYPLFHRLRRAEPISYGERLGQWLITSRSLGLEVVRDHERFRVDHPRSPIRRTFGEQMLSVEGEQHRRYKSACAGPFNARAVNDNRPTVEATAYRYLKLLARSDTPDLLRDYASPIAVEVVALSLGLPIESTAQLRRWYEAFAAALATHDLVGDTQARADAAASAFRQILIGEVRSGSMRENSLLADLGASGELDETELGSNALIILFGGIETTESAISNALWALLTHPAARERALGGDADLTRAVEESLRWEPAVQTCTRYTASDVELMSTVVPAGSIVQCMIGAMNRDPEHFRDPDTFDPWRPEPLTHTSFGFGRHFCLGAALAREEMAVAIRAFFSAFPAALCVDARDSLPYGHEFRKPKRLLVRLGE